MLTHPKNNIEKVYVAKVSPVIKGEHIRKLKEGIMLDGTLSIPDRVKLRTSDNNSSIVEITVHEGKNHEIKRLFEAVGFEVLKLTRIRIEFLTLEGLISGKHRKLKPKEIKKLYAAQKKSN